MGREVPFVVKAIGWNYSTHKLAMPKEFFAINVRIADMPQFKDLIEALTNVIEEFRKSDGQLPEGLERSLEELSTKIDEFIEAS